MSVTEHEVRVKFTGDTKSVEASTKRMAKEANKLSKQQKTDFGETLKRQKQTQKISGPQQQRQLTTELKKQNQEYRLTNRLLTQMAAGWQRVAQAAKNAGKAIAGGGGGAGRGRAGGGGGGGSPGFGAGFKAGWGPNPSFSRYGLGHGLATGARAGIGLAGGGLAALATAPIAAISSDYQAWMTYQRSLGGLAGLNKGARFGAGYTMGGMGQLTEKMSHLGYMPEEVSNMARTFGRSTGSSAYTGYGGTAAKVLGMDPSEISNLFGEMRRGAGGFGAAQKSDFQKILAAGVKAGVDASTLPEYLEGVQHLTQRAGGAAGGAVSTLPYAQLLAMFEKSGAAGLKGARGSSVLSALEEGFKSPGGGDEGLAVIMGSLGFGRAGGNTSYYSAKKMMEQGFSGPGGAGNLKNLFDYVDRVTGGGEEANLYMEGLMGGRLTLDQIETVRGAMAGGMSGGDLSKMLEEMTASELDVLHSIDDNMKEFLSAGARAAHIQKRDIDRGGEYSKSIETMQDTLHQFFDNMAPLIKDVLPAISDGLKFMTEGMTELLNFLRDPAGTSSGGIDAVMDADDARLKAGEAQERLAKLTEGASVEEQQAAIQGLFEAARASRDASSVDPLTTAGEIGTSFANLFVPEDMEAELPSDQAVRVYGERLAQVVTALDRLADTLGRGDEIDPAAIRTERQVIAAMTALGITIPAGPRAELDSTGGSP
jgi:hypothetical protein